MTAPLPLAPPPLDARLLSYGTADDLVWIRTEVGRHARGAGLGEAAVQSLLVAVNELASNTIEHSGGTGELRVWTEPGAVVCQIDDQGTVDPAELDRDMPFLTGGTRGFGLPLVAQLADDAVCASHPDGTTWRLRMYLTGR